jgi:hypothetical protein
VSRLLGGSGVIARFVKDRKHGSSRLSGLGHCDDENSSSR